ncbi:tetratricopeptide repeat protein 1 isoform X1 [Culex quinquefasciatus]|uniref:tetratricopeptide repeat protein 1 isoform X1 n=1 Tax=Culex quinquefasciatus TaxID=7176 RepID=UPI0018E29F81|nr:tetratricopeptide repeat protein 1 isoform X1 [Culex quinquefasciatus]
MEPTSKDQSTAATTTTTLADTSTSDEERFEDANEKAVDEVIEQVTGLSMGTSPKTNTSSSSEQTDKFVDCRSDPGSDEETLTGKGSAAEESSSGEREDDYIDDESQRDFEKSLSEEERLANKVKAEELKAQGNELFKQGEYQKSADMYTAALRICPVDFSAERSILYANRAAAKTKLNFKPSAIDDCTKAIEHNPKYLKALLSIIESTSRRATLYEEADKLDESLEDFKQILELDPDNAEARAAQARLPPKIQERNERMKEEMMGKLKDLGNMILRPFGLSTQNFEMKQDPSTGSYSINFKSGGAGGGK